tara:strand:+ start:631 stop:1206 length:576 start_codon:yes stop_codon:yes gene_type:complete
MNRLNWKDNVRKQFKKMALVNGAVNHLSMKQYHIERNKYTELIGFPNLFSTIDSNEQIEVIAEHMRVWQINWLDIQRPLFIEHAETMKKVTIIRALYLELLRSPLVNSIVYSNLQYIVYHKAIYLKRELSCKLDCINTGVYNDKEIRYIKLVVTTLEKYIRIYLDMKTTVSVEILRVLRCKYMDRCIMGFL